MCSCGDIGKERADQTLIRVPINFARNATAASDDDSSGVRSGEVVGVLKDIIKTCFDQGRESVRRMVCTVSTLSPVVPRPRHNYPL